MKSKSYSIVRIVTQVMAVVSALSSLVGFGCIQFSKLGKVEIRLASKPTFFFCDLGVYMCAINVLISIMSACCITSKLKIWMKLCQKMLLLKIGFFSCAVAYFFIWYPSSLLDGLNVTLLNNGNGIHSILASIGVRPYGNSIALGFQKYTEFYIRIFSLTQLASIVCSVGIIKMLKYSTKIDLEAKRKAIPKISEAVRLGCKTRILEVKSVPMPVAVRWLKINIYYQIRNLIQMGYFCCLNWYVKLLIKILSLNCAIIAYVLDCAKFTYIITYIFKFLQYLCYISV